MHAAPLYLSLSRASVSTHITQHKHTYTRSWAIEQADLESQDAAKLRAVEVPCALCIGHVWAAMKAWAPKCLQLAVVQMNGVFRCLLVGECFTFGSLQRNGDPHLAQVSSGQLLQRLHSCVQDSEVERGSHVLLFKLLLFKLLLFKLFKLLLFKLLLFKLLLLLLAFFLLFLRPFLFFLLLLLLLLPLPSPPSQSFTPVVALCFLWPAGLVSPSWMKLAAIGGITILSAAAGWA